ncbi:MAG: nucleotidyltransferase domain-containing protein [Methanospirillaceae archaeon]|nr:nucleotidyltransferase domain-containing protein [Methanospirillaceae archaeon]
MASCPGVRTAMIFGSRASGSHRRGSDIDIAIDGDELTIDDILFLSVRLDALDLPYHIDLVHIQRLENTHLLDHITRVGKCIYSRYPDY